MTWRLLSQSNTKSVSELMGNLQDKTLYTHLLIYILATSLKTLVSVSGADILQTVFIMATMLTLLGKVKEWNFANPSDKRVDKKVVGRQT